MIGKIKQITIKAPERPSVCSKITTVINHFGAVTCKYEARMEINLDVEYTRMKAPEGYPVGRNIIMAIRTP